MVALLLPAAVQAQTPPRCASATCTVALASDRVVVNGCGDQATPGRMRLTLSSTGAGATRDSFNRALGQIIPTYEYRQGPSFTDWEWRSPEFNNNAWQNLAAGTIVFAGGVLGENLIEVRPKAGAHIWSNRNASNPIQGPGELVIPVLPPPISELHARVGSAYFFFTGGKGCARVNASGGRIGGIQ